MKNKLYEFNNPIETGLRVLAILNAAYPQKIDLQQLIYYDYLTIHSGDIENGPSSLHPPVPNRSGEILVRRKIIEEGIELFVKKRLIDRVFSEKGIVYRMSENANMFIDMLEELYTKRLFERAVWVIDNFINFSDEDMGSYMKNNLDKWGGEFVFCDIGDSLNG